MEFFFLIWNEVIIRPMLNTLMVFYVVCFNNMGLAIIAFTILVRLVTLPLTLKQIRQMRRMSDLQPRMREIQETLQRRPGARLPGNHEAVSGVRGKPHRLPWTPGGPASPFS